MKHTTIIGTAIAAAWPRSMRITVSGNTDPRDDGRFKPCADRNARANSIPTPVPTSPLVVTAGRTAASVQLSLVGEDGSVAATVDDPGGVDGDAYFVGSDDVYFIDRTAVKAIGSTAPSRPWARCRR